MGVCDSLNDGENYSGKVNKKDPNITASTKASTNKKNSPPIIDLKKDYILPPNIAKHDDVAKFYRLSEKILGEGASGQVCIGENSKGKFAIKKIRKDKIRQKDLRDIISEAEISIQLKHKNIMTYYEIYEDLNEISYVMELGDMGDLFDFIKDCPLGRLPSDIVLELMLQMLDVVNYLHSEKNIVHRDIKPENFMVKIDKNSKPVLKLIDFGLSTYIPPGEEKLKDFLGTSEYAAPEIFFGGGYREKVDEWALGVVMFNMLTGKDLFFGDTMQEVKNMVLYEPIRFGAIEDEELRALDEKFLNRLESKRISAKEALEEVKQLIKEREELLKNEENTHIKKIDSELLKKYQNDRKSYDTYWEGLISGVNTLYPVS